MTDLYKPFEDKLSSLSFKHDRAEDLHSVMKTIHRLVGSRDSANLKTLDQDLLGSALIDIAEFFGKLEGRGTRSNFASSPNGARWSTIVK